MLAITRLIRNTKPKIQEINPINRLYQFSPKSYSTKEVETDSGPIKYTKSPASKWRAEISRTGIKNPRLWYEPYVVIGSITVFLLYFLALRQENDIDMELEKTLYNRIKGLEEHQLNVTREFNEHHGLDNRDVIQRLNEIKKNE